MTAQFTSVSVESLLGTIFTGTSTAIAIFTGINSLRKEPRLQAKLKWAFESLEPERDPVQERALTAIILETEAELYSRHRTPPTHYFFPIFLIAFGFGGIGYASTQKMSWFLVALVFPLLGFLAIGSSNFLRLQREKEITQILYCQGHTALPKKIRAFTASLGHDFTEIFYTVVSTICLSLVAIQTVWVIAGRDNLFLLSLGVSSLFVILNMSQLNGVHARNIAASLGVKYEVVKTIKLKTHP